MKRVSLLLQNLLRRPLANLVLIFCVASVAGMQVAAAIIEKGCSLGYQLSLQRLGADLVAVPDEFEEALERALISGEAALFYMDRRIEDRIASFDFVERTSAQLYIRSLSGAPCCSAGNIFLIGFEPESDFTVRPWLAANRGMSLSSDDVLVGSDFWLMPGDTVRFFGHGYTIAGVLEASGSGLDTTCFIPIDTAYLMAAESPEKAVKTLELGRDQISAVMIRLRPEDAGGVSPSRAAYVLNKEIYEISVIEPQKLMKRIHGNLTAALYSLRAAGYAVWPVTALLIGLIFTMAAGERRREIGLLRAMGATRWFVFRGILLEALIVAGAGAALGIGTATALMSGFSRLIARELEVPFYWPPFSELAVVGGVVFAAALATAVVAAFWPAFRACAMDPYEAVRRSE